MLSTLALVLAPVLAVAGDAPRAPLSAPVVTELEDAQRVPGVRAVFDVDASADATLALLWDVKRFLELFPDIEAIDVVARPAPRTIDVRFVVNAVVAHPTYTLRRSLDVEARSIRWVSIAGDMKRITGGWRVEPLSSSRCRVTYESYVDIGAGVVTGVYRSIVSGKLASMVERVRAAARSSSSPLEPGAAASSPPPTADATLPPRAATTRTTPR